MRINGGESCFNPGSSCSVGTTCIYKMKWKKTDVVNIIKGASYIELHEGRHYMIKSTLQVTSNCMRCATRQFRWKLYYIVHYNN